jgi:hypothetical protein
MRLIDMNGIGLSMVPPVSAPPGRGQRRSGGQVWAPFRFCAHKSRARNTNLVPERDIGHGHLRTSGAHNCPIMPRLPGGGLPQVVLDQAEGGLGLFDVGQVSRLGDDFEPAVAEGIGVGLAVGGSDDAIAFSPE